MTSALQATSMQVTGDMALSQAATAGLHAPVRNMAQIDKASKDFEGMFMSQMMQPMFQGLGVNETFGGGHGEEMMRGLLIQEYGKIASQRGGLGIAAAVKREMIHAQEVAQNKVNTPMPNVSSSTPPGGIYDTVQ